MTIFLRRIFLFAAAACMWAGSAAADYVFVFYDEGTTAGVYDAETLELVSEPEVGAKVRQAFGVPHADDPTRFVKIYIVNDDAVRVLDPETPFETLSTMDLSGAGGAGETPAVLSPDGRWLLVPRGNRLFIFNAQAPGNFSDRQFDYGRDDMSRDRVITSLAAEPDGRRAYASLANSEEMESIGLDGSRPRRLAGGVVFPEVPTAVAAAPSGAGFYAISSEGLHDVDYSANKLRDTIDLDFRSPEPSPVFDFHGGDSLNRLIVTDGNNVFMPTIDTFTLEYGAFAPFAVGKVVAPTQDHLFLLNRGERQIVEHVIGESDFNMLQDPRTRAALRPSAIDMELDLAAQNLFVLDADELLRFSADAASFAAAAPLPRAPTGFSILSTAGGTPQSISVYGGNGQEADSSGSLPRPIAVRVTDANGIPVFGAEVAFSSTNSSASFEPSAVDTNRFGIAATRVSGPVTEFSAEARTAGGREAVFTFNQGPVGKGRLTVLSGDFQAAVENSRLPRTIRLRITGAGVNIPSSRFTIETDEPYVDCPDERNSGADGIVSFQCTAGEVTFNGFRPETRIDVRDDSGRSLAQPLTVGVVNEDDRETLMPASGDIERTTQGTIRGAAGETIKNAVELRLQLPNREPIRPAIAVEFDLGDDDITPIPRIAPSDSRGLIRADLKLGCRLGAGRFTTTLSVPELLPNDFDYEIVRGPMHSIAQSQGNHQSGAPGELLPRALLAVIADSCGNPFENTPVTWSVEPEDAATLENQREASNRRGQVSTSVRLGPRPGRFSVILSADSGDGVISTTFSLTVAGQEPPPGVSAAFVNGASFMPGWTPGSVGSIFGAGLLSGIEGVVVAEGLPFPTDLRGIRVLVGGEPAPIFSVSNAGGQEQINIQVPFSTPAPADSVAVVVENSGSSIPFPGPQTFAAHPGIFEYGPADGRFAAALHADYSLAGTENPARPGEIIQLYFTGGGPIDPAVPTNAAPSSLAATTHPVTVTLDGVEQATSGDFLGSFYAPGLAAVYQVNFRVGDDASDGNRQIRIEQNGVQSKASLLPVQR